MLGFHLYTVGQRARIGGAARAYFVVGKDVQRKHIIVVSCGVFVCGWREERYIENLPRAASTQICFLGLDLTDGGDVHLTTDIFC